MISKLAVDDKTKALIKNSPHKSQTITNIKNLLTIVNEINYKEYIREKLPEILAGNISSCLTKNKSIGQTEIDNCLQKLVPPQINISLEQHVKSILLPQAPQSIQSTRLSWM
jgi:hypothetical protein